MTGDLISIAFLVTFAAVIFREHYQQRAEDRADRRSLREYAAMRRELSGPDCSHGRRCAPASSIRQSQAKP